MASPCGSVCSQWTDVETVKACGPYADIDDGVIEDVIPVASDLLFEFTQRKFPGSCQDTVRPCTQYSPRPSYYYDWFGDTHQYWKAGCDCNRGPECGCSRLSEVDLGVRPLTSIVQVKVDGDVIDPTEYRVDDFRRLVRLPDSEGVRHGWPCCQRLDVDATEDDTFEVTFTYGVGPPPAGVRSASLFAGQLAAACAGSNVCKLPDRVVQVSRQGVSMLLLDPFKFFEQGRTGIYAVDAFITAYNPRGYRGFAQIVSPDIHKKVRRAGT